ncbi:hypothetical protein BGZ63DRAFT_129805 [Mariannaea sp. PMI_226]|nr:hypothetical protein BGZ63DRAFT_129805 [Mariannaea sp. PMI_226]
MKPYLNKAPFFFWLPVPCVRSATPAHVNVPLIRPHGESSDCGLIWGKADSYPSLHCRYLLIRVAQAHHSAYSSRRTGRLWERTGYWSGRGMHRNGGQEGKRDGDASHVQVTMQLLWLSYPSQSTRRQFSQLLYVRRTQHSSLSVEATPWPTHHTPSHAPSIAPDAQACVCSVP